MILFSWNELPTYGAKLIGMAVASTKEKVCVVATRPKVPVADLEEICGVSIVWVDKDEKIDFRNYFSETPSIFFQAGWYIEAFKSIGESLRLINVPVVLLSDNSYKSNLRQLLGRFYFRTFLRNKFSAVWVPGESGRTFMRNNGVSLDRIYDGLYGSDEQLFTSAVMPIKREKVILFAGRLVPEKGILELVAAFDSLTDEFQHWQLEIYGNGPLFSEISTTDQLKVSKFVSVEELAQRMGEVKIFCLPSHSDHWPLVVNEAALAGCALVVSDNVGNSNEFCRQQNSAIHKSKDVKGLKKALIEIMKKTDIEPDLVVECSKALGSKFDKSYFPEQFNKIINEMRL
jgi:glycosyltransferase involved in cell wall biosynthesis